MIVSSFASHFSGDKCLISGDNCLIPEGKCPFSVDKCVCIICSCVAMNYSQDGMICLAGCDKTIPGVTMALPRLDAVSELLPFKLIRFLPLVTSRY